MAAVCLLHPGYSALEISETLKWTFVRQQWLCSFLSVLRILGVGIQYCKFCRHFWGTEENNFCIVITEVRWLNLLFLFTIGSGSWFMRGPWIPALWLILHFSLPEGCGGPRRSRINWTPFQKAKQIPFWPWQLLQMIALILKCPLCSYLLYSFIVHKSWLVIQASWTRADMSAIQETHSHRKLKWPELTFRFSTSTFHQYQVFV